MTLEDLIVFEPMPKIPRLNRRMIVTEKLDGTNASIHITDDGHIKAASRTRWLNLREDNYGFAAWVTENRDELLKLGPGHHFGEWYGQGINRNYGLANRRFALFNVSRWNPNIFEQNECLNLLRKRPNPQKTFVPPPACCEVVPLLLWAPFCTGLIRSVLDDLKANGSSAVPGFMRPEGLVVFHEASNHLFKVTIENDEQPKSCN